MSLFSLVRYVPANTPPIISSATRAVITLGVIFFLSEEKNEGGAALMTMFGVGSLLTGCFSVGEGVVGLVSIVILISTTI